MASFRASGGRGGSFVLVVSALAATLSSCGGADAPDASLAPAPPPPAPTAPPTAPPTSPPPTLPAPLHSPDSVILFDQGHDNGHQLTPSYAALARESRNVGFFAENLPGEGTIADVGDGTRRHLW
jgi:hypothetical protein